jgi:HEPN domain-containing protein
MSESDAAQRVRAEARRWAAIADQDIAAARHCLAAGPSLLGIAAYHCQQAAEKLIKSALVLNDVAFPRTHDLVALTALALPAIPEAAALLKRIEPITVWGFAYRYPSEEEGAEGEPSIDEVRRALLELDQLRRVVGTRIAQP